MANISLVWDLENVTPPSSNTLFIDALWDYAESLGRVVSARAYCDWSQANFSKLSLALKKYYFYMVHVPSERKKKNSVDIQMVSDTLEQLRYQDHLETFVLVTGDSDFRPLLVALRRAGKIIHVVCDIKTASPDLLALADEFVDYRDILPGEDEDEETTAEAPRQSFGPEYWYSALAETVGILVKEGKPANLSSVKIKMKMLNPAFAEKALGFSRWGDFVSAAVKHGVVQLREDDRAQATLVIGTTNSKDKGILQKALKTLLEVLNEMDSGREPQYHEYSVVSSKFRDRKMDLKSVGFSQFKKFIAAAEVRGLVESQTEGMNHYVKRAGG